MKYPQKTTRTE